VGENGQIRSVYDTDTKRHVFLRQKIHLLSPITFILKGHTKKEGKLKQLNKNILKYNFNFHWILAKKQKKEIFEPPSISLKYDCQSQILILHINFDGKIINCDLAQMTIQTNTIHHNFIWKLEFLEIISSIKTLESSSNMNNNNDNKELVVFRGVPK
jgi:hypothetical protein